MILANGILQIAFPAALNPETGRFDISFLFEANISVIVSNIGENIPKQIFTFINFMLTKYLLEPALLIVGAGDLIMTIKYKFSKGFNKLLPLKNRTFDYQIAQANRMHMFTISMMYMIISPLSAEFMLLIQLVTQICEQYVLLYKVQATADNEISPGTDIIEMALNDVYTSSYYLLVCTLCFCLTQRSLIMIASAGWIVFILLLMVIWKINFDKRFRNAS